MEDCEPGTPEWFEARNNLAVANMRLVDYTIRTTLNLSDRYNYRQTLDYYKVNHEDLTQAGYIGLIEACSKATVSQANSFPKYASLHIKKQVTKYFHHNRMSFKLSQEKGSLAGRMRKKFVEYSQQDIPVTLDKMFVEFPDHSAQVVADVFEMLIVVQGETQEYPAEHSEAYTGVPESPLGLGATEVLAKKSVESLHQALDSIPWIERRVLKYRFGLTTGKPESLHSSEVKFCMSGEQIKKIEARGFARLLHPTRLHRIFFNQGD